MESIRFTTSTPASRPQSGRAGGAGATMNDDLSIPDGLDRLPAFLTDKLDQKKSIKEKDFLKKQLAANAMSTSRAASRSGGRKDLAALLGSGSKLNAAQREELARLYITHGATMTQSSGDLLRGGNNNVFLTMTDATSIGMPEGSASLESKGFNPKLRPLSPARANTSKGVIGFDNTEDLLNNAGHKVRYFYKPRGIEIVSSPARVQMSTTRELKEAQKQRLRKSDSTVVVRTEGNEDFVEQTARVHLGPGLKTGDFVPQPNRDHIVAETQAYYRNKAKNCADEVRKMRGGNAADRLLEKSGKLQKVSINKRIHSFRKAIMNYLDRTKDPQRGEIMKQIKDEMLFEFMEQYKGYTMSPDTIISLLGTSLGMNPTTAIVNEDFESNNVGRLDLHLSELAAPTSPGGSPTLRMKTYISARNEAVSPLRDLIGDDSDKKISSIRFSAGTYAPPTQPHLMVSSRPTSRHGSGFIVSKLDAPRPSTEANDVVELRQPTQMESHYSAYTPSLPSVIGVHIQSTESHSHSRDNDDDSPAIYTNLVHPSARAALAAMETDLRTIQPPRPLSAMSDGIDFESRRPSRAQPRGIEESEEDDEGPGGDATGEVESPSGSPIKRTGSRLRKRRVQKPLGPEPEKVLSDAEIAALANRTLSIDDLLKKKHTMLRADERLSNLLK